MGNILLKELKLSASCLSYFFILFGLMFFLPGYPVLCGVFFVTLGIFKSFQYAREANDILFSALLPISKRDVVTGKYLFTGFIELCSLLIMGIVVIIRMTVLGDVAVYMDNALMNANCFALGLAFFLFGIFNLVFVCGFFKTAYQFGRPFVTYMILAFIVIIAGEALHHFPGLEKLNAFGTDRLALQVSLLVIGIISYVLMTIGSHRIACKRFEKIDL